MRRQWFWIMQATMAALGLMAWQTPQSFAQQQSSNQHSGSSSGSHHGATVHHSGGKYHGGGTVQKTGGGSYGAATVQYKGGSNIGGGTSISGSSSNYGGGTVHYSAGGLAGTGAFVNGGKLSGNWKGSGTGQNHHGNNGNYHGYQRHHYHANFFGGGAYADFSSPFASYDYLPYGSAFAYPASNSDQPGVYQSFYGPTAAIVAPAGAIINIGIGEGGFSTNRLVITIGTTVCWNNTGQQLHGLAQPFQNWQSPGLPSGQSFTWTFTEPGSYTLQDPVNPGALMTIIVN
jgi:plastocyanin